MRMNVDGTKQVRQHLTEAGQENSNFVNNPFDVSVLSMEVDSNALFRRDALPLIPGRKKEGLDEVLVALLSEANQELAHLLRDVRAESQGVLLGGHQIRPVNELLMRAVRCAAQQYLLQAELGNLALTDELTGLYNRRGFMALAERQLKVGRRWGREMLLFFIDLDGLKQINDSFGHSEGDRALKRTAQALEMAFRDSDVIARVAGDEFAILAIEAAGDSEVTIRNRLCEDLKSISSEEPRYTISLSLGAAQFDPRSSTSLGELMVQADRAMYEGKRGRSKPSAILENGYRTQ
jgi:diguanylate cyclase (GGDEF)-like protein